MNTGIQGITLISLKLTDIPMKLHFQLTNWGLMELARLNPCLEYCSIEIETFSNDFPPIVTQEGIARFKNALPRAPHDRCSVSIISSLQV